MILFEEFWVLLNFNFGLSFGIESEVVVVGDALFLGLNRNQMLWWWVVRLGCSAMPQWCIIFYLNVGC